MDLIKLQTSMK